MKEIIIAKQNAGQRMDKFLKRLLPAASSSFIYKMLRKKNITLNGRKAEGDVLIDENDIIRIFFSDETFSKFSTAEAADPVIPLSEQLFDRDMVIYEDESFAVINKPAGMLTQKSSSTDVSLNDIILAGLIGRGEVSGESLSFYRPSAVNRLDRNTSGIVLFAKTLLGARFLSDSIKKHTVKKEYLCIVCGCIDDKRTVTSFMRKDKENTKAVITDKAVPGASVIKTVYEPVERLNGHTLLKAELITGKFHQIRSQLSYLGFPIIGDPKYGNKDKNRYFRIKYDLERQLLHAYRISFPEIEGHFSYLSGKTFTAPVDKSFQRILSELKKLKGSS